LSTIYPPFVQWLGHASYKGNTVVRLNHGGYYFFLLRNYHEH
jgi:hypothetical protein